MRVKAEEAALACIIIGAFFMAGALLAAMGENGQLRAEVAGLRAQLLTMGACR